jgi:hypothetical protein
MSVWSFGQEISSLMREVTEWLDAFGNIENNLKLDLICLLQAPMASPFLSLKYFLF